MAINTLNLSILQEHKKAMVDIFDDINKGKEKIIDFALIKLKPYDWGGKPSSSILYRRYDYKEGKVAKKLSFDSSGQIEIKEEYEYNKKRISSSIGTTKKGRWLEEYDYDAKGKLLTYKFLNATLDQGGSEKEVYEYDTSGRTTIKKRYDRNGFLELVTEYIYEGKNRRYSFRCVTDEKGELVITFVYNYNDQNKLIRLAGIEAHYKDLMELSSKAMNTKLEDSKFISYYTHDDKGNMIKYVRTIPKGNVLNLECNFSDKGNYIVGTESDYEYKNISKKDYLVSITQYDPRYREPIQVKEYTYYDNNGECINPDKKNTK
jgi:hypothetical protein